MGSFEDVNDVKNLDRSAENAYLYLNLLEIQGFRRRPKPNLYERNQ